MPVKKRRDSIYIIYEGLREGYFLKHLQKHSDVHLNSQSNSGGSANQIVIDGIKHSARGISVYILFDEDFESKPNQKISNETFEGLAREWKLDKSALAECSYTELQSKNVEMRNPVLIVSHPQSIEGFLLKLLDIPEKEELEGKTTKQLKTILEGMLCNVQLHEEDRKLIQTYDDNITKYKEEMNKQKPSEPNYKERRCYFGVKIEDYAHKKNEVIFLRFLSEKLPLPTLIAKRTEILEIDILLNAFGL